VFERYNIVSGRDLKDATSKLESYLAKQKAQKRGRDKCTLGTIRGQSSAPRPLAALTNWIYKEKWSRGRELNSRPADYESAALPLSYLGVL
jgi:hypothetical protein